MFMRHDVQPSVDAVGQDVRIDDPARAFFEAPVQKGMVPTVMTSHGSQSDSILCRYSMHSNISVDPTDAEHAELCALLCRSRSTLTVGSMSSMLDRVCARCGAIDPRLQRFIASLRRLRAASAVV